MDDIVKRIGSIRRLSVSIQLTEDREGEGGKERVKEGGKEGRT